MYTQLQKETAKFAAQNQLQGPSPDEIKQVLNDNVRQIADACLVNSLQSQYGKTILSEDEASALDNALIAIRTAINPGPTLHYENVRNGFVELFGQFLTKSEELVPGTNVSFAQLSNKIQSIDSEVTTQIYHEKADEPEPEPEEQKEVNEPEAAAPDQEENWAAESDDGESEDQDDEEQFETTPHPNQQAKGGVSRKPHQKAKQNLDADGFTVVKDQRFYNKNNKKFGKRGGRG